jgi:hypothetical protein
MRQTDCLEIWNPQSWNTRLLSGRIYCHQMSLSVSGVSVFGRIYCNSYVPLNPVGYMYHIV